MGSPRGPRVAATDPGITIRHVNFYYRKLAGCGGGGISSHGTFLETRKPFPSVSQQPSSSISLAKIGSHAHPDPIIGQSDGITMISLDASGFPLPPRSEAGAEVLVCRLVNT